MPTYEYRCPQGHDFEHFFSKISDSKGMLPCPRCGQEAERRISGGSGLLFKGSGFYITDYGKDGKKDQKPAAKSGDAAAGASAGGESKGSDPKGGESKGSESKGSESKGGGDAKGSGATPAPTPTKSSTPKPSSSSSSG